MSRKHHAQEHRLAESGLKTREAGFLPGWVWLCGAGPGDPQHLTLAVVRALSEADVVLHDALVDERVLAFAGESAVLEAVGKRAGQPSPKQTEISARMIALARAGKRVVRLKGGDPFVFGRGAEEALELTRAGVPFRVLPGVSAGIGGLAQAGIPLTHRDLNQSVTFITGHDASGALPTGLNWRALAEGSPVIVVYMGLKFLGAIASALIEAGRAGSESLAIVSRATTSKERVVEMSLDEAALAKADFSGLSPALIVIGPVVRLRHWLNGQAPGEGLAALLETA